MEELHQRTLALLHRDSQEQACTDWGQEQRFGKERKDILAVEGRRLVEVDIPAEEGTRLGEDILVEEGMHPAEERMHLAGEDTLVAGEDILVGEGTHLVAEEDILAAEGMHPAEDILVGEGTLVADNPLVCHGDHQMEVHQRHQGQSEGRV